MIPIRGHLRGGRAPTATVALLVLNLFVFFFEAMLPDWQLDRLVRLYGLVPAHETAALAAGQLDLLPVLTSMFMHGGWAHLLGNMLYLWVFGSGLEGRIGSGRFTALYFLSGFLASQAQVLVSPFSMAPMIGASGAIAGVLGAYVVLQPMARITVLLPVFLWPLFFDLPAFVFLGVWFLQQLLSGTLLALSPVAGHASGIAFAAHVGGFIGGALFAWALRPRPQPRNRAPGFDHPYRTPGYPPGWR